MFYFSAMSSYDDVKYLDHLHYKGRLAADGERRTMNLPMSDSTCSGYKYQCIWDVINVVKYTAIYNIHKCCHVAAIILMLIILSSFMWIISSFTLG